MNTKIIAAVSALSLLAAFAPASAHHSTSLYVDVSKTVSVQGVFSDIKYINPHVQVRFYAPGKDGQTVLWSGETHNPASLSRLGWKVSAFRKGEKVTVSGNPSRDGSPYVQLTEIVFSDGYKLSPAKPSPPRAPAK